MNDVTNTPTTEAPKKKRGGKPGPRVEPVLTTVASGIPMPAKPTRRGSVSPYPFDSLTEKGQCFGIKNKTAKSLTSVIANVNKKHLAPVTDAEGKPTFETKPIVNAEGQTVQVPDLTKPKMSATKRFVAFDVTPEYEKNHLKGTALSGSSVLIFREI